MGTQFVLSTVKGEMDGERKLLAGDDSRATSAAGAAGAIKHNYIDTIIIRILIIQYCISIVLSVFKTTTYS